jgi:hypothetical protein
MKPPTRTSGVSSNPKGSNVNELYLHFPGQRVASLDDIERLGYGDYLDRGADGTDVAVTIFDGIAAGPTGAVGSLAVVSAWDGIPPSKPVAPNLENQFWSTTASEWDAEAVAAYIGWRRDFPPTPHTLRRRMLLTGTKPTLGGEEWQLPILLRLPLAGVGPDGTIDEVPVTKADRLAHRFARDLFVELAKAPMLLDDPNFCPAGARPLVEYALSRNYRGDWRLWQALGCFDDSPNYTLTAMLHAIGVKAMADAQDGGKL